MVAALHATALLVKGKLGNLGVLSSQLCPPWAEPVKAAHSVVCTFSLQSGRPSLKQLSEKILGIKVQQAEHCSVSIIGKQPLTLIPRYVSLDSRHRRGS